jgi:hypothetical protein
MHFAESRSLTHTPSRIDRTASRPNLGHTHTHTHTHTRAHLPLYHSILAIPRPTLISHLPSYIFSVSPPSCLHLTCHILRASRSHSRHGRTRRRTARHRHLSGDDDTWTPPARTPRRCSYDVDRGAETGALVLRLWLCRRVCVVAGVLRLLCEVRRRVNSTALVAVGEYIEKASS